MLLVSQRVLSPGNGTGHGVNLYLYKHGPRAAWTSVPEEFTPERDHGTLMWKDLQLPTPGNRVVSYLDVVAPDAISHELLCNQLATLKHQLVMTTNPTGLRIDPFWFRLGLGNDRVPWATELAALAAHLVLRLPADRAA